MGKALDPDYMKKYDKKRNATPERKKWRLENERKRRDNPVWVKKRNEYLRKWRIKNKIKRSIRQKETYNPNKQKARNDLHFAVSKGIVKRPNFCETCHKKCQPHGHHHMGYNNPLKVIWLCARCHMFLHKFKH